ncbi:MAG: tetratricopeptide repeat protein [Myxococcota bacterium]
MTVPTPSRWLFGPLPDLLLGCGGAYLIVFALLVGAGPAFEGVVPHAMMPLLVLVTSIPHYGATLLRVYEEPGELRRYRLFAVWISLLVYGWFAVAVFDPFLGSLMVTLYLTWSPWHYSGQNYGIAMMFLGRRGIALAPETKRWLYASFLLSFVLAFLGIHTAGSVDSYAPGSLEPEAFGLLRLGVPPALAAWLLFAAALGYGVSLAVVAGSLLRTASARDLAPVAALVGLQGLWFSAPVLARATGVFGDWAPFGGDARFREYAFLWVAIGHAVQYLWVTSYYAVRAADTGRRVRHLGKATAAGGVAFGLPLLVFGPDALGRHGYDAGLALLIASAVNLHHFVLDGAIWKLRDGRIARVLLRAGEATSEVGAAGFGRLARTALLVFGAVYALSFGYATIERELGVRRAQLREDFERMAVAARRLRWVGRDDASLRHNLAIGALRRGDLAAARSEVERSLALQPTPRTWVLAGMLRQREGDAAGEQAAYEQAVALDAGHVPALVRLAAVRERAGDRVGAREALGRALEVDPARDDLRARRDALASGPAPD